MATILSWCADGRIRPHIHQTYRLEDTARALGALAAREVKGKAVLVT
jgi:NADPH2:quinone reductase